MEQLFAGLDFFATETGVLIIMAVIGLMILTWDWRVALAGLVVVQTGVAAIGVARTGLPAQWAGIQVAVMAIAAAMLAISAVQTPTSRSLRQAGNWPLRLLAVVLIYLAWRTIDVTIPVPGIAPDMAGLFTWLGLAMLLMLGLSDNPLFSVVALLFWFIPAQVAVAGIVPHPGVFALIGGLELLVTLTASYLTLVDRLPATARRPVLTDIVFPDQFEKDWSAADDAEEVVDASPLPGFVQDMVDSGRAARRSRPPALPVTNTAAPALPLPPRTPQVDETIPEQTAAKEQP